MEPSFSGLRHTICAVYARLLWATLIWFVAATGADATDRHWTGTTNTTWGTTTNWDTAPPSGTTDNAVFDRTFTNPNQPNLGATTTAGGLWMTTVTGTVGQNVTISGLTLTLQGNTINGTGALGILVDNANAFTLTINAPLTLGAAQTWRNNSGNLLTIGGAVSTGNKALTIDGTGNTTISGVLSSGGALTKTGNGILTLSGANTYNAGTTLSAGTLNINSTTALGTGPLIINAGTIDNTTAGTITVTNNNAITLGGNFTFGGTRNLNLGTGAITNNNNRTITLNGSNSTLTLGGVMTNGLGANQTTIVNGVGNTLSLGGYALSNSATNRIDVINGTGNVNITGVVANGSTSTAGALTYSGTGVLTLGGANTFGGALTIQSGTLSIATINNASTAGVLGNSATPVTLGGSGTTGTLQYTGSTASSTKTFTMATGGTGVFNVTNSATHSR